MAFSVAVLHPCRSRRAGALLAMALLAFGLGGCLRKGELDVTGSLGASPAEPAGESGWRSYTQQWEKRYAADPTDKGTALNYARGLRALEQRPQATAVLQQAAIRAPKDKEVLGAYGRSLSDAGRFKEAAEVLSRAHTPERPDWRILSAQGAIADQLGDQARAEAYYEAALRIAPGEPSVLSNLGLSYALSQRLPEAEHLLRQAADHPRANARVRQNLALVLGLQGKFAAAEDVLKNDMSAAEAAENVTYLKRSVSQANSWQAIRGLDRKAKVGETRSAAPIEERAAAGAKGASPES